MSDTSIIDLDIDFFTSLFNRTFLIGDDTTKISNKQMIDTTFVQTLLDDVEAQFISDITNKGYSIIDTTPTTNIKFFICYQVAKHLIMGNMTMTNADSTLKLITEQAAEYETRALQDVNKIVQQKPITGGVVKPRVEALRP